MSLAMCLLILVVVYRVIARPEAAATIEWAPGVASLESSLFLPLVTSLEMDPTIPRILTTISLPAGSHPHGIALDVAGQRAFVGNHGLNTLSVLDTAALELSASVDLPGAGGPNGVAYDPVGEQIYIANRNSQNVSVVDGLTLRHQENVDVEQMPAGLVIADDLLYVANFGSNSVSIINTGSNEVTATLAIGLQPSRLAADKDRGIIYLSAYGSDKVYAWQGETCCLWHLDTPRPYGLTYDPITNRLYAVNRGDFQSVSELEASSVTAGEVMGTAGESYVAAINPRTGHLFVTGGDVAWVFDRRDRALIVTLPVGAGANEGLAVDPSRNRVYITSSSADLVTIIEDTPTLDVAYTIWHGSGAIMLSDDTGEHRSLLTEPDLQYGYLNWRPGGKVLAFSSFSNDSAATPDIYRIEAGGGDRVKLTDDSLMPSEDLHPDWSPDGSQIAWQRNWQIWIMDEWGARKRQLTPDGLIARSPQWSPDGKWIAFVAFAGEHEDIFLIAPGGGPLYNLTNHPAVDLGLSWSPNGQEIVFETDRDSGGSISNWELYKVNVANVEQPMLSRLTTDPANDHRAAWSNDGSRIAFLSDRGSEQYEYAILVMNPDGQMQQTLTAPGPFLGPITWSPDDHWLMATGYGDMGYSKLFRIGTGSGQLWQLTQESSLMIGWPVWRPDTWE